MSQNKKILEYMQRHGAITPVEAIREFGCMRLSARIHDLRAEGHNVRSEMVNGKNRDGDPVRYARYWVDD